MMMYKQACFKGLPTELGVFHVLTTQHDIFGVKSHGSVLGTSAFRIRPKPYYEVFAFQVSS
jgi:hypothetical protein